jgi:hypothetical protein
LAFILRRWRQEKVPTLEEIVPVLEEKIPTLEVKIGCFGGNYG